jgi:hypothetical protein
MLNCVAATQRLPLSSPESEFSQGRRPWKKRRLTILLLNYK